MKLLIVAALIMISCPNLHAKGGKNFPEKKAKILENLDQKITMMQEKRTCINAAEDHAAIKACHQKFRGKGKGMRHKGMNHEGMNHKGMPKGK